MAKVSVIIPVYKVEEYAERCVRSLMEQTLEDMEYIFVDDCSPDRSMQVIERVAAEYPRRLQQVKILRHDRNSGVAAARTTGMRAMTGEYMAQCDPDDYAHTDMYRSLYDAAKERDADVVSCLYTNVPGTPTAQGSRFTGTGLGALRHRGYTYGLWDKIIRTSIIRDNEIYPYKDINYNEDLSVIVRALCYSPRVVALDDALYYHTVGREGSICSSGYKKHLLEHSVPCLKLLDEYLDNFGTSTGQPEYSSKLTMSIKFWLKAGLLAQGDFEMWCSLWPECKRIIPRLTSLSAKERIVMTLLGGSPKILKMILG